MLQTRFAGPDDLDRIDAIEAASFEADRFARRNLARMLRGGKTLFILAEAEGEPAGYLALSLRCGARKGRIYSLAVHPQRRGLGAARALIRAAKAEARRRGLDRLGLEVRENNAGAQNLYKGEAFRLRERRPRYYEDGETALVLEWFCDARPEDSPH